MAHAVNIKFPALQEMADDGIGLVLRLAARPVQFLAGVVLLIADEGNLRDFRQRGGKIIKNACPYRNILAFLRVGRKNRFFGGDCFAHFASLGKSIARKSVSILPAISGFVNKKMRACSTPCPSRPPLYDKKDPVFSMTL